MRVRLVVTGDLEKAALGPSLERVLRAAEADVAFDRPLLLAGGAMTTTPLPDPSNPASRTPTPVQRMARALVTETFLAPARDLPDLVVGIDDLELANAHQPHIVTAWLRRAIDEHIAARFSVLFARALFEDLSGALGVANPLGGGACSPSTFPERHVRAEALMLRNL